MTDEREETEEAKTHDSTPPSAAGLSRFTSLGFFAADHAAAENGKIYVSGGYWSVLRFPAFPATLPSMALVAVLQQPFHLAHSDHAFTMTLRDSDNNSLPMNIDGQFRAAPGIDSRYGDAGVIPVVVPLYGLTFQRPGEYSFVLCVDGEELDTYAFRVIQVAHALITNG